ncbi:DNA excision repair protein ERCC-1 [Acorus calamus]|uniref:DNA excision repair protein ERCC-1 n=1 Tax=Acorus calamus TaxID=4465 RepID=A0AAV9E1N1_ACOCL|nr:DNA excision repair protein ERCC-1 [Acorus calamus]
MEAADQPKKNEGGEQINNTKGLIKIPSYQEVFNNPFSSLPPPSSSTQPKKNLSRCSLKSLSEAFSSIKSSEFYIPPPEPPSSSSSRPPEASSSPASSSSPYRQNRNAILVSHRQKGNPLLKHIRNVRWVFTDIVCDYLLGQSSCALYLSLRYHLLHPDYLYYRIRELQKNFKLCVVLCHVDVEDVVKPLLEVTRTALLHECTLLCAWSLEECGRYLETIKIYENKPSDIIQERMDTDYLSRMNHALTAIRHINKTDVVNLGSAFGSLSGVMDASMEELARCPGIGERKVKRLHDTFHEPFKRVVSSRPAVASEPPPGEHAEHDLTEDNMIGVEKAEAAKHEKEPSLTVKSALTAAFAKYSDKVHKKDEKNTHPKKSEGTNKSKLEDEDQSHGMERAGYYVSS